MNIFDAPRLLMLFTIAAACVLAVISPAGAQFTPERPGGFGPQGNSDDLVTMRVALDTATVKPGDTFHLVFLFDIKPKWHLYWKNPAAGAAPIEIDVTAPHGFIVEDVRWPRPTVYESNVGDMYGYGDQVALFVPIRAPLESVPSAAALQYNVGWAVCDDQRCVMGSRKGMHTFSQGLEPDDASELRSQIRKQRARLPIDADESSDVDISFDGETLTVTGPAKGYITAEFFPNPTPGVRFGEPDFAFKDRKFTLTVTVNSKPRNFAGTKPQARALIGLGEGADGPSFEFSYPLN